MSHKLGCELCYQRGKYSPTIADSDYCQACTEELDTLLADVQKDMERAKRLDDFDTHSHSDESSEA